MACKLIKFFKYSFINIVFSIISFLQIMKLIKHFNHYLDRIYTLWISNYLKEIKGYVHIERYSSFSGLKYISIGENTYIYHSCCIEAIESYGNQIFTPEIIIGKNVKIGEYNHITAIKRVVIGNGVLTGRRVTITDNNHGIFEQKYLNEVPSRRFITSKGEVIIGENVWIGENVCILSGVSIGKGCVIAANSVVTKSIPDYCMVAGVPGKIIKIAN